MVLETVVSAVLNRFLNAYVANVNASSLNFGVWSGDLKLRNLRLKKEALDKFRLPVDVIEGYLGELTLNIPWSNLKGKPVKIIVDNVYLLATPTDFSKSSPEEDEARRQAAKQEKLENAELISRQPKAGMTEEEEKRNESFTASLVTKIVDNLQIEVRNIHIRYEDHVSVPEHPFSAGFTLSGFSAVSTDEHWTPTFIHNSSKGIHKLAKLESLAIYFDTDTESLAGYAPDEAVRKFTSLIAKEGRDPRHQFILKPVSGEGRLVMNRHFDSETPKTDAEFLFQELGFVLDAEQYRDALSMVDLFHFYVRQREYQRFRPPPQVFEGNKPRALLRFALDAIRSEVHERNRKWSWDYFRERRDDRREYLRVFKLKEKEQATQEDHDSLEALERKLEYTDIRFYRSLARSELRKERNAARRNQPQQQPDQSGGGWLGWIWGGGKATSAKDGDATQGLTEEQRKELYDAIDWDERDAVSSAVDVPQDTMKMRVKAKLERGSFALRRDPHGKARDLVALNFDGFQLDFVQRPENFYAMLGLHDFQVFDGTTTESLYPQVVRVKSTKEEKEAARFTRVASIEDIDREADEHDGNFDDRSSSSSGSSSGSGARTPEVLESDPFFWFKFEHKPLDGRADNALGGRLRHMEIIYHRGYVEEIVRFFKPPESQLESVNALIDVASETIEGIRKETRAGLEYALAQHSTVDVKLDLNAPIIIVPEDITKSECTHIVLDAGHIAVQSEVADQEALEKVREKEKQEYAEEDYRRLESLMYDKFHVKLEAAQLLMGPSLEICREQLTRPHTEASGEYHVLERTSLSFLAQNCILPKAPNLTRFKVSGSLPDIQLNFSDRKYKDLMRMIDVAIPHFDDGGGGASKAKQGSDKPAQPTARESAPVGLKKIPLRDQEKEYHLDAEDALDDGRDDGKDEFFDTQDISDGTVTAHQKTFEFSFSIDRVQGSIFRSDADPKKPDRLLVNTVLEGFKFDFTLRPYDMSVDVVLRTLYIEDKMIDDSTDFRHLLTSGDSESENLFHVRYHGINKESPEYMTVYEGIDKTVDVEMSTISVIVTRASILTLFDWIMATFTDQSGPPPEPDSPDSPDGGQEMAQQQPAGSDKLRVKVKMTEIRAVLNEDGMSLATLSLSAADVLVMLRGPTLRVAARLGNLSLVDNYSAEVSEELLSIKGDHLADFQYETYDPSDPATFPGYESHVFLRTGSLKFTFIDESVNRLLVFFSKFAKMKAVYDAAARAAAQRVSETPQGIQRMHYDILIKTPIVELPRERGSKDAIVANLGEIRVQNEFDSSDERVITKIQAGLHAVRLTSDIKTGESMNTLHMLDDVDFVVDVTLTQNCDPSAALDVPATQITAKMTDVKLHLTQAQYAFVMQLLQSIPSAFSIAQDETEATEDSFPVLPAPPPEENSDSEPTEVVDLMPELGTAARRRDGKTVPLKSSLELNFAMGTIYLELYTAEAVSVDTLDKASLARFSLHQSRVQYKMLDNGAMEAEVVIHSFTVNDTRPTRQTHFRDIIPQTTHSGHLFMLNFTQSGGKDRSSMANIAIDSPEIFFSLDPLFALLEFFMSAFPSSDTPEIVDEESKSSRKEGASMSDSRKDELRDDELEAQDSSGQGSFAFRVNVVSPCVYLLENPEREDSEAIVLSINQIQMSQQGTLALTVDNIGMLLCRMDRRREKIRVLDDFDLTMTLDKRADSGRLVTSIDVAVQALILRVSPRDIFLIASIVSRAIELSNKTSGQDQGDGDGPSHPDPQAVQSSKHTRSRSLSTSRKRAPSNAAPKIDARVLISKESLRATFDSFQLILIGDYHDLPLLDIKTPRFSAKVKDWSSDMKASVTIMPYINYFNLRISHWEPLMDPWEFAIHVSKTISPESLSVTLSSRKRLELNVTSTFIELAMSTAAIVGREGDQLFKKPRGSNEPFVMRNRTGFPITLTNETTDKGRVASRGHQLLDAQDQPWRFDDWRAIRENIGATSHNSLSLKVDGTNWDQLRRISVDREGEYTYSLRPKVDRITHRLLCEVKLVENVKIVTFRSTYQVENRSLVSAEMMIVDAEGKPKSQVYKIPPGQDCPLPLASAYSDRIKIRPDAGFGYVWSSESYHWKDLVKRPTRAIICRSPKPKEAPFRFQAFAVHDKSDPMLRSYPKLALRLRAPIEIQNLLPFDVRYRVFDKNLEHNWQSYLRKGGTAPIHVAELSHLLLLSVEVQDTVFQRSEFAIINTDNPEDLPVESTLVLPDAQGLKLNLGVHYQKHPDSGGAFRVQIYSPYIFLNKTGYEFAMKTKTFLSTAKEVAGQTGQEVSSTSRKTGSDPFMFSFPSDDRRNRVYLKLNESNWSKALSFETVGVETEVVLPSVSGAEELHAGLKVTEGLGDYKITKVVTVYPRFIVKNSLECDIRVREVGAKDDFVLPKGERQALGYIRARREPRLSLAFTEPSSTWSAPIKIQDIGTNHLRLRHASDQEDRLIEMDAILEGACIFVRLEPTRGQWPFLIRNESDYVVQLWQKLDPESGDADMPASARRYSVDADTKLPYAWDYPSAANKQLRIAVGGRERTINVLEIGSQLPFRFSYGGHTRVMSIDVRAEGSVQAIILSNYHEENSVFKPQRRAADTISRSESIASSRDLEFEAVDVDVTTTFSLNVNLEGIGISVINRKMQELVYASFRGLTARYADSTTSVSYDIAIKWIQIDNQLFGGLYPILLYPSVIPKDGKELEIHPSLQASAIVLKDESHGVTYFKYASALLQEMTIEVDEDFLFALLDFAKFPGAEGIADLPSKLTDEPEGIPEPSAQKATNDVYFEVLHLHPVQLDLSFMRTERVNVDQKLNTRNPFFFFINALTMALGNVNDAPVRLNALVIENVRLSMPILQERLQLHYSQEFFGQLYRVLGSADFLGNPVGLFTNVSSGVADFFIQPYDSIMMNGNKDLGIGIARGAGSLAKKTVFGLSDSLAKVTGSVGKGLSAATLDKQFQSQRRIRQHRNRPKHALYGVTGGATALVTSVASGFEGLATKPIEGAETEGAAGFFKGVGKGVVGAFTKPVVGIFDFANNVTEGIRNTTQVFEQGSIDRVRLPRFTASDGILRPYQEREALGQNWLKNLESGKYFSETYVAHLDMPSDQGSLVTLLTTSRIALVRVLKLKIEWDVQLSDLQTISLEPNGITLKLRDGHRGPFLQIPDQSARLWFFRHIERVVEAHNARRLAE